MLVKELMTSSVITVKPETLVSEVAEILHQYHFTGVPVVNDQGVVVGMISERDFITSDSELYLPTFIKLLSEMDYVQGARKSLPYSVRQVVSATAHDIMNKEVVFAKPEMTIEQLAETFALKRINPIPVTDNQNKLLGIVSRSDLIKLFSPKQFDMVKDEHRHQKTLTHRTIDDQVNLISDTFKSKFAYVAKARANIWLTTGIVLFIVGFLFGVIYVADPNIFKQDNSMVPYGQTSVTP